MIESIATAKGHVIGARIDIDDQEQLSPELLGKHDVAIEFSRPETAYDNISRCLDAGIPVVSGTTGWTARLGEIIERCRRENGSFLYASNFSLGVNILFYMNRQLASIMSRHDQYDVRIREVHHTQKLDAPSGTAITLAEDILGQTGLKKGWTLMKPGQNNEASPGVNGTHDTGNAGREKGISPPDPFPLQIEAVREGKVAGVHEIIYESGFDVLSLRHSAKDRRGFATGAVLAAEFIRDKKGVFTMKEVLNL